MLRAAQMVLNLPVNRPNIYLNKEKAQKSSTHQIQKIKYLWKSTCTNYVLMLKGVQFIPSQCIPEFPAEYP